MPQPGGGKTIVTLYNSDGSTAWVDFVGEATIDGGWDINSAGVVVGTDGSGGARWVGGVRVDGLPGIPFGINDSGIVVGRLDDGSGNAFIQGSSLATEIVGMREARDINNLGLVVGGSAGIYSGRAMLWDGQLHDLNDLIEPNSGVVLYEAMGINDSGQIVAIGDNAMRQRHSFLLSPLNDIPEPTTLALFALGLSGLVVLRRPR